jgi:2-keto-3-deoxy-L-rhamnonate aldolase RhmA
MKQNHLRYLLDNNLPSVGTRIESTWPLMEELVGAIGCFDYVEFVAEYAPFSQIDLENITRAAELSNLATMIKVDFQNRAFIAQKAMASGFQAVLFTDHKTADEVRESLFAVAPDAPKYKGRFGYPNRRWVGYAADTPQIEFAEMVNNTVKVFMIEKIEAMENIEEICSVPGIDMVQFGPSDYSLSLGWNAKDHREETLAAERLMIKTAFAHGIQVRCEINEPDEAKYYLDLGVKHFCIGDELRNARNRWTEQGKGLRKVLENR